MDAQGEGMYATHKAGFVHYLCKPADLEGNFSSGPELYTVRTNFDLAKMPKNRKNRKSRKSKKQLEKKVQDSRERMSTFLQKKDEERAEKDSLARKQALERLGITQEFNHADHVEIYNYSDLRSRRSGVMILMKIVSLVVL